MTMDLKLTEEEAAAVEQQVRDLLSIGKDDKKAVMMAMRMALAPGATKNVGGVQYQLNQHHRWQRANRDQPGNRGRPSQNPAAGSGGAQSSGARATTNPAAPAPAAGGQQPPKPMPQPTGAPQQPASPADKTKIDEEPITPPPPGKALLVDVEKVGPDGVAETARVGIPGRVVAPPPPIPKLPNLTERERKVEQTFIDKFMQDPDGVAQQYRELIRGTSKPYTFETDQAKCLSDDWNDENKELQRDKRHRNNNALHQTANAIVKRAFLQHLNTLQPGDSVLVTVGGCGAGKGFVLKNTQLGKNLTAQAKAVWDSAGDQNATENPWILEEATKRGLKVTYAHITADPKVAWGDKKRGAVTRATDLEDGRMVDAAVFADSYAMGAKNHHAFHQANANNPNATFLFFDARNPTTTPEGGIDFPQVKQVPPEMLKLERKSLYHWAMGSVQSRTDILPSIQRGATQGARIWNEELA